MDIRLKLVIIFVTLALTGFVLFGAVAYTGSRDLGERNEIAILHEMNDVLEAMSYLREDSLEVLRQQLLNYFPAKVGDDRVHQFSVLDPADPANDVEAQVAQELGSGTRRDGVLVINDRHYVWAAKPVTGTGHWLLSVRRSSASDVPGYVSTIAVPLAIAMLIVVWIALWLALILGSLFRKVNEQKDILHHQARHDPVTDLPNHHALMELLDEVMQADTPRSIALCVLDLNRFKEINDSLGRSCGDALLRQVGQRLTTVLRMADRVARVGGDEFAVLVYDVQAGHIDAIADKLIQAMHIPFEVSGQNIYISVTMGMAMYPGDADDPQTLAQRAEIAMYHAKQAGRDHCVFSADLDKDSAVRLALINDLREAIEHDRLQLHYQPQLDLHSNAIIGVEALARWHHPQHGAIPPEQFITLAEHSGLIRPLTSWVLETACMQWDAWRRAGLRLNVSVNISAWNLQDQKLEPQIRSMLRRWDMPPSSLKLEITETAMMTNPAHALEVLNTLDTLGIRLSIDDFGIGYSSLSYLKKLPVDEIKIDKSFVLDMIDDEEDASIVRATVSLAHDLGLSVVAEGIESDAALRVLRDYGCDRAQGYYISHPLPAAQIEQFLKTSIVSPRSGAPTVEVCSIRREK